jgi:hypothetical protein
VTEAGPLIRQLRIPTSEDVRNVWPSEAADFTPWLAENLDLVADLIDLKPLELVEMEMVIPGTARALDILARLPTGDVVAIENQYKTADHDHMTRGLAYAVGLNAVALVIVAESHLQEFRAVASYLNSVAERSKAENRIGIYLISLSVERVEEYVIPRLTLIESPNRWIEVITASLPEEGIQNLGGFLQAVPEEGRASMQEVVGWWTENDVGTIRYGAKTGISLDRPRPGKPGRPLSHVVLNTNGTYTIQRGYLIEGGAVGGGDRTEAFDEFIRRTFPDVSWQGKHYYLTSQGPPNPSAIMELVHWLEADA